MSTKSVVKAKCEQVQTPYGLGIKAPNGSYAVYMDVTPELAAEWLTRNACNRPINTSRIERYAQTMTRGEWESNGEAWVIGKSGNILNAQHRGSAVVKSGVTVHALVIFDMPDELFKTYDQGIIRKLSDEFYIQGTKNATSLAASVVPLYNYLYGPVERPLNNVVVRGEARDLIASHPGLVDSVAYVQARNDIRKLYRPAYMTLFHYLFTIGAGRDEADRFMKAVAVPENMTASHPCFQLNRRMMENQKPKLPVLEMQALVFKAWNAYLSGKRYKVLSFKPGVDVFPMPLDRAGTVIFGDIIQAHEALRQAKLAGILESSVCVM